MPIVSALKNYYIYSFLEVPADILNHFWLLGPGGRFASETAARRNYITASEVKRL
jgi:hypothetical protein